MATAQNLLDDLNARLGDASNAAGVGEATKLRWLNNGLRAMWPRVYRTVTDSSLVVVVDTFEYTIPSAVGDYAIITRVDVESTAISNRYIRQRNFYISPLLTGRKLMFEVLPSEVGAAIRLWSAKRLTEFASTATTFDGPPGTDELPVWYALGLALNKDIPQRADHVRLSVTRGQNSVDIDDKLLASQFAFAQFELLLDRHSMPHPSQAG